MSSQEISWPVTWQRLIWIFLVSLLKQINCLHSLSVSGFIDWKSGSRKTTDPLEMQLISSEWTLRQVSEIALWLRRVDRRWRRHFHFYALVGRWEINCLFLRTDKKWNCLFLTDFSCMTTKNIESKTYQPFKQSFKQSFDFHTSTGIPNQIWSFIVGKFFFPQFLPAHFQAFILS